MDGRMLQRRRLQAEGGQLHAHAGIAAPAASRRRLPDRPPGVRKADAGSKRKRQVGAR